jgi:hypothetical protein
MRGLGLHTGCFTGIFAVLLIVSMGAGVAGARTPDPSRYPLRVHVLASDNSYRTPRMSPGDAVVCDAVDSVLMGMGPNSGGSVSLGGPYAVTVVSGDACSIHPEMITGRLLDATDDDPIFSGEGRADLVSPPLTTQGFNFHYDNCARMRVRPGFQSLPARWKSQGKKLEVLVPSDDVPRANGRPLPPERCTFTVTVHNFVYLLLRNGAVIQVPQELYAKRPAMRVFLSGNAEAMQERPKQFEVPAHPTN